MAFSADGLTLAALVLPGGKSSSSGLVMRWDMTTGKAMEEVRLPIPAGRGDWPAQGPAGALIWSGPRLLNGHGELLDLDHRTALWRYGAAPGEQIDSPDGDASSARETSPRPPPRWSAYRCRTRR